jgi:hypothetical protein
MSSSTLVVVAVGATGSTPYGPHHRCLLQLRWWLLPKLPAAPLRGPAIDIFFNFSGGYCRSYQQHLPGSPPLTSSSILVVDATRATDTTPQGANNRCLVKLGICHQYFSHDTY